MENKPFDKKQKRMYQVIILLLLLVIIVLTWSLLVRQNTIIVEKEAAVSQKLELQNELEELMAEHERIKEEYDFLSDQLTDKDSMIIAQAKEIEQLINSQADYRKIKRQLDYLRGITQGYVSQIDSLYKINQELVDENIEIKRTLKDEKQRTFDLTQSKEELEGKITSAAVLRAYNVTVIPLLLKSNGKESEEVKANKTNAIRVCFTLSENSLIPSGTKDIYMRIARPDNLILTQGGYSFLYQGERIQFSEKISVQYNQKSQNVCMTYKRGEVELMKGKYHVNLFADDQMVGEASFSLK